MKDYQVQLTTLEPDDLPTIVRWFQQPEFLRLFDARPAYPQTKAVVAHWLEERQQASDNFIFAIRLVTNNNLLGYLEIEGILWTNQVGWVNIAIGNQAHWGKSYGYEAMQLALQFAFDELNLYRL